MLCRLALVWTAALCTQPPQRPQITDINLCTCLLSWFCYHCCYFPASHAPCTPCNPYASLHAPQVRRVLTAAACTPPHQLPKLILSLYIISLDVAVDGCCPYMHCRFALVWTTALCTHPHQPSQLTFALICCLTVAVIVAFFLPNMHRAHHVTLILLYMHCRFARVWTTVLCTPPRPPSKP
jgi:hypothetical protein